MGGTAMKNYFFIIGAMTLTLVIACPCKSQTNDSFTVSIASEQTTFTRKAKIPLRVTVDNQIGRIIKTSASITLHLTKYGLAEGKCTLDDCYIAATRWDKTFRNGETREIDINVAAFAWMDLLNSLNFSTPDNFYQVVHPGTYYLFMDFTLPNADSRIRQANRSVQSNLLKITIEPKSAVRK